MTLLNEFRRTKKDCLCPVCGKPDWCLISRDAPPSKCICSRTPSPHPWGEAGWLHRLRDDGRRSDDAVREVRVEVCSRPPDLGELAERCRRSVRPDTLARHAADLGLSVESLRRLGIGWTPRAWVFPMTGADDRICGVRYRAADSGKWSEKGGKEGLFTPAGLDASGTLAIAEGPTDTAALLDLGLEAVGRPSCTGGTKLLALLVRTHRPAAVAIFADSDGPGQRGAAALASVLATCCQDVRLVTPPSKDTRAWLNGGATPAEAIALIGSASPLRLAIRLRSTAP
jgi:hypothetical protein